MSFIGSRQLKFGCANVPPIKRQKCNITGFESVRDVFAEAIMKKMCHEYSDRFHSEEDKKKYPHIQKGIDRTRAMFNDCIEQTISFLRNIAALKVNSLNLKEIKLWQEGIKMEPFYEGVNVSLSSMLVKHHFPRMAKAMNKGAIYSHYSLTQIDEAVLYVMEFFTRDKLLGAVDKVIVNSFVQKWIKDNQKYVEEHKEEIEREERDREAYRKKEEEEINKSLASLKDSPIKEIEISNKGGGVILR